MDSSEEGTDDWRCDSENNFYISSPLHMQKTDLEELFNLCDADGSGFIEKNEIYLLCPDLDNEMVEKLLAELDTNGDGKISIDELHKGMKSMEMILTKNDSSPNNQHPPLKSTRSMSRGVSRSHSLDNLSKYSSFDRSLSQMTDMSDDSMSSHLSASRKNSTVTLFTQLERGHLCPETKANAKFHNEAFQLYCHLQEDPQMLQKFEVFIEEAVRKIKEKTQEKEEIEQIFEQEQKKHQERLIELEEEAENISRKIQQRTEKKLKEKFEQNEKQYQEEINLLRDSLEQMKDLENEIKRRSQADMSPLKTKLQDMEKALRTLRSEKTEAETNYLLAKSQLANFRQNLEQHSEEREKDKELVHDYMTEQINLARQVNSLQEANKYLQDHNSDLQTEMMSMKKRLSRKGPRRNRRTLKEDVTNRGSDTESGTERRFPRHGKASKQSSMASVATSLYEEIEVASNASSEPYLGEATHEINGLKLEANGEAVKSKSLSVSLSSDGDCANIHHFDEKADFDHDRSGHDDDDDYSYDEDDSFSHLETMHVNLSGDNYKHLDSVYCADVLALQQPEVGEVDHFSTAAVENSNKTQETQLAASTCSRKSVSLSNSDSTHYTTEAPPERIYKVIFAGDSGTGKSSFIMSLCKGVFTMNMQATLGIDFQTKNTTVDGTKVSLQLWDTAGQERFRCIAAPYFRKADGVVLLYDCCSERSFSSVRQWVQLISDSAESNLPIIICANKTDLRKLKEANGVVTISESMGQELAKEFGAMFCETSAKEGENLDETIQQLAKALIKIEDKAIEEISKGLHLHDEPSKTITKKKNCC